MSHPIQNKLSYLTAHLVVALAALVGIGGATRVMEAGLACPDWPLCYGSLLPGDKMNLQVFLEWFHRLDAFIVSIALVILFASSTLWKKLLPKWLPWISCLMLVLIVFQAGLGALTVVNLLPFGIVTAHLAIALLLVALISASHQGLIFENKRIYYETQLNDSLVSFTMYESPQVNNLPNISFQGWWTFLSALTTIVAYGQSLVGGLMATQWTTQLCFQQGVHCQWIHFHRFGGILTGVCVTILVVSSWVADGWKWRQWPLLIFAMFTVIVQILLGMTSMRLVLSAPGITIAHQITAAVLIATLAALTARGFFITSTISSKSSI